MKRLGWILIVLSVASPAWAAKKITVQQLQEMLASFHQAMKTDAEVATELKQVELTEELTPGAIGSMVVNLPGVLSNEQISVLEIRSAVLAPPPSDLPSTAAPSDADQKAILSKAADYISKSYAQLPHLSANRRSLRYQDNMDALQSSSRAGGAWISPGPQSQNQYVHYIDSANTPVESQNGAEIVSKAKDKTPWGENRETAIQGPAPALSTVMQEAQAAGKISWLRWETVNGNQIAVFSFAVDKKKTHYAVDYCCFPKTDESGAATRGFQSTGVQLNTSWEEFKATVPYHGELFVDPSDGTVVRLIVEAEFKPAQSVQREDQRIDYSRVTVDGKTMVLPVRDMIDTEVLPGGDNPAAKFAIRHSLFTYEFKNYRTVDGAVKN
jgi:hypothetical protein